MFVLRKDALFNYVCKKNLPNDLEKSFCSQKNSREPAHLILQSAKLEQTFMKVGTGNQKDSY